MIVRQSTIEDVPQIIALLKLSIGEALTPKTEAYFLWKHEHNYFGRSKVLLAIEDGNIIGLRAFMHWQWVSKDEDVSAVRAVDTATDPAFQGKGIFKKLTLRAVEDCTRESVDMVFNSPNKISMQGYLKMGWKTVGRLPLYLGTGSLLPRLYSKELVAKINNNHAVSEALKKMPAGWSLPKTNALTTPMNTAYLSWRYRDCPVATYGAAIEPGNFGFIFRIKKLKRFTELRICEAWTEPGVTSGKAAGAALRRLIKELKPAMVSSAESPLFLSGKKKITKLFGPFRKGPVITIRPLATENLNNFENFDQWQPSLGSIELF